MKGLTLLWMCLCCLRPEDVANVLPHSEQAWARAPTCCERMCLWRLLGSVNTCWGEEPHRHMGELLSASNHVRKEDMCTEMQNLNDQTFPSTVITLPLSSFHIRSACHCRATSDVGSGLISSWRPWDTDHTYILSPHCGTNCGPPGWRKWKENENIFALHRTDGCHHLTVGWNVSIALPLDIREDLITLFTFV